jgi:hypothetical protein
VGVFALEFRKRLRAQEWRALNARYQPLSEVTLAVTVTSSTGVSQEESLVFSGWPVLTLPSILRGARHSSGRHPGGGCVALSGNAVSRSPISGLPIRSARSASEAAVEAFPTAFILS